MAINKRIRDFIRTPFPRIPTFYTLPKVHKPGKLTGRPIVSGSGSLKESASTLVDRTLKPRVEVLPSFVKDTLHFLKIVDGLTVPPGSILVMVDIECLYNSIPHT